MTSPFYSRAREVTSHYGHVNRCFVTYLLTYLLTGSVNLLSVDTTADGSVRTSVLCRSVRPPKLFQLTVSITKCANSGVLPCVCLLCLVLQIFLFYFGHIQYVHTSIYQQPCNHVTVDKWPTPTRSLAWLIDVSAWVVNCSGMWRASRLEWSLAFFIFVSYKVRRSVVNLPNATDKHNSTVRARKKRFKNSLNPNAASTFQCNSQIGLLWMYTCIAY